MAHAIAGRPDEALQFVEEAITASERMSAPIPPDLLTMKGDFLLMGEDPDLGEVDYLYETAKVTATKHKLRLSALIALIRQVQLRRNLGRDPNLSDELQVAYSAFTEGFDEVELVTARQLLGVE